MWIEYTYQTIIMSPKIIVKLDGPKSSTIVINNFFHVHPTKSLILSSYSIWICTWPSKLGRCGLSNLHPLAPLKWFFSSNFSKHAMHTSTSTHFCLSTHDYKKKLSSINKIMIIQLDIKNINNQSKGKHNHTHNHMKIF